MNYDILFGNEITTTVSEPLTSLTRVELYDEQGNSMSIEHGDMLFVGACDSSFTRKVFTFDRYQKDMSTEVLLGTNDAEYVELRKINLIVKL